MNNEFRPVQRLIILVLLIFGFIILPLSTWEVTAEVSQPVRMLSGPDLVGQAISTGGHHSCGIRDDGTLLCWGLNDDGQTTVPAGSYTQVSAGNNHTCGFKNDGSLHCWGKNTLGQTTVPAGTFVQVSAGAYHTCAIEDDDTLTCWGNVTTPPTGTFAQVSAGSLHSCALHDDGTLECWGRDDEGQTTVPAGSYVQTSAGGWHSCGLQGDGTLLCWGVHSSFDYGQHVVPAGTYSQVSAGWGHTCGLHPDGSLDCWGRNLEGQITVPAGTYTQVSAWLHNTCALKDTGELVCWGEDADGQTLVPARTFTQISAGNGHTCAIENDGSLHCWGKNSDGETDAPAGTYSWVSAGEHFNCSLTDTGIAACWGLDDDDQSSQPGGTFSDISAGTDHACAVYATGSAWVTCWGSSLGYTSGFPGSDLFSHVSAGFVFTCGLRTNGTLYCWGLLSPTPPAGTYSQVSSGYNHACALDGTSISCWGNDDYNQSTVPAGTYAQVSAGHLYTCGLLSDHSIDCWGYNGSGETDVPAGSYGQISAGCGHACALTVSGYPVCWGEDTYDEATVPDFFYSYGLDTTPPSLVSNVRADPNPTNASSVDFTVTFSEYVTGVDISDFSLGMTGFISGHSVTSVEGAGTTYTVTASTGTGSGTLRLFVNGNSSIRDAVNLPMPVGSTGSDWYTVDKTPPTVSSVLRTDADPTEALLLDFNVTFSENVTGVDSTDFDLATTGSVSGAFVSNVSGSGDSRVVTVNRGTGDNGTVRLDVLDNNSIRDAVNNSLDGAYSSGQYYTISSIMFQDDFETNDFSLWTRFNSGNGFLYTCGQAAINGSYGACVERGTNDKRKQLIDDTPVYETTFNARFNFDINNLSMTTGERFRFMQFKMDALRPAFIVLKYQGGQYLIQLNTLLDDLTKVKTGWYVLPNAPRTIEVEWQQASGESTNDGIARLYLDEVLQEELSGLDNFNISITSFRMGFTSRLVGKSISGIFYIDDVATSTSYIGPP